MTGARVVDQAVLHSVVRIARVQHSLAQRGSLGRRNEARLVFESVDRHSQVPGMQMSLIVRRGPGDDAIEVCRVTLRLHETLPTTRRAAIPVGEPWSPVVERCDETF